MKILFARLGNVVGQKDCNGKPGSCWLGNSFGEQEIAIKKLLTGKW